MTPLDLRVFSGYICAQALSAILGSVLYHALTVSHGDVEVWDASIPSADGFAHFWLVSLRDDVVRGLAHVRYSCRTERLQEQIHGPFGQDSWVDVEAARRCNPTRPSPNTLSPGAV